MEMNDILNGLNSCDDDCSDSMSNSCSCGPNFGGPGMGGFPGGIGGCGQGIGGFGQGIGGCGFSSWIWILLILFYCGCGKGGHGRGRHDSCCCEKKHDCCCEEKHDCCDSRGSFGGGILSNCSPYLFILVILFLCNSSNSGFGGGCNPCNNSFGC